MSEEWQSTCGDVRKRLTEVHARGLYTDCELEAGAAGERIPAHRMMLASASPVLAAMLFGAMPAPVGPLPLPDIEPDTARSLIKYIYMDEIKLKTHEEACNLYRAAHYLLMPHVEAVCTTYLLKNVAPASVLQVFEFAQLYNEDKLKEKCLEVMCDEASAVLSSVAEQQQPRFETLDQLFAIPNLRVTSEMELFHAAERWMRRHCAKEGASEMYARSLMRPVLKHIRFLVLQPEELARTDLSSLLERDDILAISLNLHSKDAHMAMPKGFSTSRAPRIQKTEPAKISISSLTITLPISERDNKEMKSDIFYIQDLPWQITIGKNLWTVTVKCIQKDNKFKCDATVNLKILSHDGSDTDMKYTEIHSFTELSNTCNMMLIAESLFFLKRISYVGDSEVGDDEIMNLVVQIDAKPPDMTIE